VQRGRRREPDALTRAHSIAADASGNLYVADRGNARIQVFDNQLAVKATYDTVGSPWALCISPGPHQYLFSATNPQQSEVAASGAGDILKMELDGTIVGRIGRADNPRGVFRTIHHLDCRHPDELLGTSNTRDGWAGFIRLAPQD
jgi:DNA-binding beta-propeller fold protein YncE